MPPSQKETPFKRKDIAKAFFDVDLSDEPSTASKTPKPPSQKGTPFKRKDIAKAFFDLDLSGEPSTASKTPKPRDRNRLIASKSPS
jgi:hypothetical protein